MGDYDRITGVMQPDADRLAQSTHATRYYRDLLCHRIVLTNTSGVLVWEQHYLQLKIGCIEMLDSYPK
jgi:hypothetical protein